MEITQNYDLDVDTSLGGADASDYVIPSQKAIKAYVDNASGGGTVDQTFDGTSANAQSGVAIAEELGKYATRQWVENKGYTSNVGTVTSVNSAQPDSNGNVSITIPEQIVYIVNYGEATFLAIFNLITSGKTVLCKYNNEYMLPLSHFGNDIVFSQIIEDEVIQCTITSTDQWSVTTTSLADTDLSNLSATGNSKFQAPLGYTPVNKAGDTMTGGLSVRNGGITSVGNDDPRISILSDLEIAGTLPSSTIQKALVFRDKNNTWLGSCSNIYNTNGSRYTRISSQNGDGSSATEIRVGFDANDNTFTFAPNPSSTSNDNNIVTTSFVRKWAYGEVVKKSTDIISSNTSLNGSTNITYNLGSTGYLPSDYTTYPYAVYLSIEGLAGNAVGNYITIGLASALVDNVYVTKCKTYVANSQALCGWGGWFPVGTDGRIYLARSTSWNGHVNAFRARAYCRMN